MENKNFSKNDNANEDKQKNDSNESKALEEVKDLTSFDFSEFSKKVEELITPLKSIITVVEDAIMKMDKMKKTKVSPEINEKKKKMKEQEEKQAFDNVNNKIKKFNKDEEIKDKAEFKIFIFKVFGNSDFKAVENGEFVSSNFMNFHENDLSFVDKFRTHIMKNTDKIFNNMSLGRTFFEYDDNKVYFDEVEDFDIGSLTSTFKLTNSSNRGFTKVSQGFVNELKRFDVDTEKNFEYKENGRYYLVNDSKLSSIMKKFIEKNQRKKFFKIIDKKFYECIKSFSDKSVDKKPDCFVDNYDKDKVIILEHEFNELITIVTKIDNPCSDEEFDRLNQKFNFKFVEKSDKKRFDRTSILNSLKEFTFIPDCKQKNDDDEDE